MIAPRLGGCNGGGLPAPLPRCVVLPHTSCEPREAQSHDALDLSGTTIMGTTVGYENFSAYARHRLDAQAYDLTGGHQDDALFAASLRSSMAHIAEIEKATRSGFSIVPGFLHHMTPNAFADRVVDTHYIGFHQALMVTLAEFGLFVFTQPYLFTDIGDAKWEDAPVARDSRAPGLSLLETTLAGQTVDAQRDRWLVPKDANRQVAGLYLALLMARFVWLHEVAHCQLGHVGLVQDRGIALRLYEIPEALSVVEFADEGSQDSEKLRLLEFEADSAAFAESLTIQTAGRENIAGIAALPLETRLTMTGFAAYAMTWLFGEYQRHTHTLAGLTHPHPHERLENLLKRPYGDLEGLVDAEKRGFAQFLALGEGIPALADYASKITLSR